MNAAMIELFLRSSGAPPAVIETFKLLKAQGMDAFKLLPIPNDDPKWDALGAPSDKNRLGLYVSIAGPKSKIGGAIFLVMEGETDEIFDKLSAMAGTPVAALPSGS